MVSHSPEPEDYRPPGYQLVTWLILGLAVLMVLGLISLRTDHQPDSSRDYPSRPQVPDAEPVLLPPPPMDDEYLPCSDCHEDELPNPTERVLEDEHDILVLKHGTLWCLDCHDLNDREKLTLANDELIEFADSWMLCTQCHGKKLADWRAGVHGKRTGHWRGPKEYRTCVACHDPHSPPFEPLEPKRPPRRPYEVTVTGNVPLEAAHE